MQRKIVGTTQFTKGAEFEVRQNYGNKEVVATLVTDKDGNAISGDLPYGKYTLRQTKAGGEYAIDGPISKQANPII